MIHLKNIHKTYHNGADLHVLKGIDLDIEPGEFVAIMGASGSGKSTLLNILGILDNYDEGEYILDNTLIKNLSENKAAHYRNHMIGFVFQSFNLVPVLSVYENIVLPIELDGNTPDKEFVDNIIDTLGLSGKRNSYPNQLSGGQQQRVAIARALSSAPQVILADEPTGNLDSKTSQDVMGLLKVMSERFSQTIIVITHNEEIAQMADRIIRIEDGLIAGKEV